MLLVDGCVDDGVDDDEADVDVVGTGSDTGALLDAGNGADNDAEDEEDAEEAVGELKRVARDAGGDVDKISTKESEESESGSAEDLTGGVDVEDEDDTDDDEETIVAEETEEEDIEEVEDDGADVEREEATEDDEEEAEDGAEDKEEEAVAEEGGSAAMGAIERAAGGVGWPDSPAAADQSRSGCFRLRPDQLPAGRHHLHASRCCRAKAGECSVLRRSRYRSR
jgi:hypothetical protein